MIITKIRIYTISFILSVHDEEERVDNDALEVIEEEFEEYTWSGQTRIRASSLVALGKQKGICNFGT